MKKIHYTLCSNIGTFRKRNEDNYCCNGEILEKNHEFNKVTIERTVYDKEGMFAVFDGIGGLESGDSASRLAAEEVQWYHKKLKDTTKDVDLVLKQCVMGINEKICVEAKEMNRKMGTTASIFYFCEDKGYIVTIGDSRIYHYTNGRLDQISRDDNVASEMEMAGIITPQQAKNHMARHSLTQYLGMPKEELVIQPHSETFGIGPGRQTYILCTDGLWEALDHKQIKETLETKSDRNQAELLVQEALKQKGKDNITVVIVEIIGGQNDR